MTCLDVQNRINDYLEDKMEDDELTIFLDHIEHCRTCRGELELYFTLDHTVKALDQDTYLDNLNLREMLDKQVADQRAFIRERESNRLLIATIIILTELMLFLVLFMFNADVSGIPYIQQLAKWVEGLFTDLSLNNILHTIQSLF
ncbi:MAG: zf-HC2 domain-containing protein [Lachnospiraceae bacterium]|nr:zf-HC2 domain-containing protein [Candidatus Equihabitans merdae]